MAINLNRTVEVFGRRNWKESLGILSVFGLLLAPVPANAESYSAKVVSVPDGDSLNIVRVGGSGKSEKAILYGVDCPEMGQEFGPEARAFTDGACYKKEVKIDEINRDAKGRIIAKVYLPDGSNLNQQLVERGLAWWSDKYAPDDKTLKLLHDAAKAAKRGLWSSATKPIPPWIFRNGEKSVGAQIRPKE
ncbi:MAG TPA: thermonuclease family protein [Drouetiella sp.]